MIVSDEELEKIRQDSTEFVDRLKDKLHFQEIEIERLKGIINKLEKVIEEEREKDRPRDDYNYGMGNAYDYVWYKLQELKENK